jgi:hypothetical protein
MHERHPALMLVTSLASRVDQIPKALQTGGQWRGL